MQWEYQHFILHPLYSQTGRSALYLASWQGQEIVAQLLKHEADVNQQKEVR